MTRFRSTHPARNTLLIALVVAASVFIGGGTANADLTPIGLGTATNFAIRAGTGVSNTGVTTKITGDLGLNPAAGTLYTGLTCANMTAGSTIFSKDADPAIACHTTDAGLMTTVENDARTSFVFASGRTQGRQPLSSPDLTLQGTLGPGLYSFGAAATNLSGALTLDAGGNANAVWIFQASSSLITSSNSTVNLINGANPCNVFWTVQSSATIATGTTFVGTILAFTSIFVKTGANVTGRLLAANDPGEGGAVTLDTNTIIRPAGCPVGTPGTGGPTTPAAPATPVASPPKFTG